MAVAFIVVVFVVDVVLDPGKLFIRRFNIFIYNEKSGLKNL